MHVLILIIGFPDWSQQGLPWIGVLPKKSLQAKAVYGRLDEDAMAFMGFCCSSIRRNPEYDRHWMVCAV